MVDEVGCVSPWWDCDYTNRRALGITTNSSALSSGYALALVFDHAALVTAGKSRAGWRRRSMLSITMVLFTPNCIGFWIGLDLEIRRQPRCGLRCRVLL
ncbi:MAG: hypothetical protein R3C68_09245 [Myxococcota bacterium]